MSNYREVFTNRHAILPVVHVENERQTLENTRIAEESGCDGVFLISMTELPSSKLLVVQNGVKDMFPDFWIGVNFLDRIANTAFKHLNHRVDGLWTDNAFIDESEEKQDSADRISKSRKQSGWDVLYFGGVAFKYQLPVKDYALVAKTAKRYMDVVTTSGSGTGTAPALEKIRIMKEAIGEHPLGIASGISPDNVYGFKPYADAFLVASSLIIQGTERFDKHAVIDLVSAVRG